VKFPILTFVLILPLFAQPQADVKQRAKTARDLGKQGEDAAPRLAAYVTDPDLSVRLEAVKSLDQIGGPKTVDLLVRATRDNDPEIQIRATDGLVNAYIPGYIKGGISGTIQRVGNSVKAKFTDTNDQIVDAYVEVRPEVIEALGRLATGGASLESRANACRALGILRGRAAAPQLIEALHSKDDQVMYESLIALQKISDPSAGPGVVFLLRDLNSKVQIAAIETAGLLKTSEAAPALRDVLDRARDAKVKRAALASLAMIGDPADRGIFLKYLADSDDAIRTAAAEGLGRIKNQGDRTAIDRAFTDERRMNARLSLAFAEVSMGNLDTGEFSPLRYLVNTLNLKSYQKVASAYLVELARDQNVRQAIYPLLMGATKDEKLQLGVVLAMSGDADSVSYLQSLQADSDPDVAKEGIRDLRTLRARLP